MSTRVYSRIDGLVGGDLDTVDCLRLRSLIERRLHRLGVYNLVSSNETFSDVYHIGGNQIDLQWMDMVLGSMIRSIGYLELIRYKSVKLVILLNGRCIYLEIK